MNSKDKYSTSPMSRGERGKESERSRAATMSMEVLLNRFERRDGGRMVDESKGGAKNDGKRLM